MRKLVVTACLALLLSGCESAFREEGEYNGVTTSQWIEQLHDENVEKRREAAQALGELGPPEAEQTAPELATATGDADRAVRFYAIRSIGKLGLKGAKPAKAAVARAINDPDKGVMKEAMRVYRQIAREEARELLSQ
jgi:HEAT repeat protein